MSNDTRYWMHDDGTRWAFEARDAVDINIGWGCPLCRTGRISAIDLDEGWFRCRLRGEEGTTHNMPERWLNIDPGLPGALVAPKVLVHSADGTLLEQVDMRPVA